MNLKVRYKKGVLLFRQIKFKRWFCGSDEVKSMLFGECALVVRTIAVNLEDLVLGYKVTAESETINEELPAMQPAQHRGGPQASI